MKYAISFSRVHILVFWLTVLAISGYSQTQPVPYNLSNSAYHFTSWDSLSLAGTYPANMIFQFVPANRIGPFYNDSTSDFTCPYNMTRRPRIIGYMDKGIGLLTTSSSQYNDCNSGAADHRFMGAVLLSLNASGRTNIMIQWKSETLLPGDGNGTPSTPRIWNLRLQYRVGTAGNFTDVPGPVEFIAGLATGDSITFGPTVLPTGCNNKPVVQVRWIYFESSAGSGGTRPRLRLDDISVQSDPWVGLDEYALPGVEIYPNPAENEFFLHCSSISEGTVRIMDNTGRVIREIPYNAENGKYDCSNLSAGIYFVKISDGMSRLTRVTTLIIK